MEHPSNATNVLACIGRDPHDAVRAQANPEPQTRATHARVPTLTPDPDMPAAQRRQAIRSSASRARRAGAARRRSASRPSGSRGT